jgi:hypothetical protein
VGQDGSLSALCSNLPHLRNNKHSYKLSIRALRNSCAGSSFNAKILIDNNIICEVFSFAMFLYENKPADDNSFDADFRDIVTATCQLYANFCNCGEVASNCFWQAIGVCGLTHLLAISFAARSQNAIGAVMATIHACILHDTDRYIERRSELLACRCIVSCAFVSSHALLLFACWCAFVSRYGSSSAMLTDLSGCDRCRVHAPHCRPEPAKPGALHVCMGNILF